MLFLEKEAARRGDNLTALAERLGIGYVYLSLLYRGLRPPSKISRDILIAAAKYLKVPVAQAYLWAGALQSTDFSDEESMEMLTRVSKVDGVSVYDVLSRHSKWGGFAPSEREWTMLAPKTKLLVTLLFEQVAGLNLIEKTTLHGLNSAPPN